MKIVELNAENVKRLRAVNVSPTGNVVVIAGRNAQGKSSVLDAIAMAIGGSALVPDEPIRKGETRGEVSVDLGEYVVTRTFTRDRGDCDCDVQQAGAHTPKCASKVFGPVRSNLTVKTKEGARYPSPQALLDRLVGDLTFDPLAFVELEAGEQRDLMRRLAGIDTTTIDEAIADAAAARTEVNREVKALTARLAGLPFDAAAPLEEVSVADLSAEVERVVAIAGVAEKAKSRVDSLTRDRDGIAAGLRKVRVAIAETEAKLAELRAQETEGAELLEVAEENVVIATSAYDTAVANVPDPSATRAKIAEAEATNKKVRANRAHVECRDALRVKQDQLNEVLANLDRLDHEREKLLSSASFPVPGLGITDRGVKFDGVPFDQLSTAEQLRISIAIGARLNPKLKVLLVRGGNDLDDESLAHVAAFAAEHDLQVWIERIAGGGDSAVVIEDGAVRS